MAGKGLTYKDCLRMAEQLEGAAELVPVRGDGVPLLPALTAHPLV